jgi:hypothetical protein
VNKHSEGIVYRFADGAIKVITVADYLAENPDKTEADFAELKAVSDSIYLEQERGDYRQTWKNCPNQELDETELCAVSSPEDELIAEEEALEKEESRKRRLETAYRALDTLTESQRRRYLMYHVDGLTLRQIADKESVLYTKIQSSIAAAEKKIKKFLAGGQK